MRTRKLTLCVTCSGSGRVPCVKVRDTYEACPFCKGTGRVWEVTEIKYEPYLDPLRPLK